MAESVQYMACGKNTVTVRVVSYEDRRPVGTLSSPQMPKPLRFSSMAQLLFFMEELMDRENSPQRETEARELEGHFRSVLELMRLMDSALLAE